MNFEDMNQIKVDISEENGTIVCKVSAPAVCSHFPTRVNIGTGEVAAMLERKGHTFASVLSEARVNNKSVNSPLAGTWVFLKKAPPAPKKRNTKPRTPKTTNSKK